MRNVHRVVLLLLAVANGFIARPVWAQEEPDNAAVLKRLDELEQEVRVLKRQLELSKEQETTKTKDAAVAKADADGFSVAPSDKAFQLKIRGYVQAEGRFFADNEAQQDSFLLRRARPIFEGTLSKDYGFRIMPDFGAGSTTLQDAHVDVNTFPKAKIRIGKFKPAVGLERLQSDADTVFVERALPTNLVPNRDIGAQVGGDIFAGTTNYAIGVFNGIPDGSSADSDTDDDKDLVGRIFVEPFKQSDAFSLRGLGLGVAGTYGHRAGAPAVYRTPGQQTFISYRSDVNNDGTHIRLSPQATYYWGPVGLQSEYAWSQQELVRNGSRIEVDAQAWQVTGSYLLTGEDASYKTIKAKNPFSLADGRWGAWELAARYSGLVIADEAYDTFINSATSSRRADAYGLGVNWYLNKNMKWQLDFEQTHFDGGSGRDDRDSEQVLFARWQVAY